MPLVCISGLEERKTMRNIFEIRDDFYLNGEKN